MAPLTLGNSPIVCRSAVDSFLISFKNIFARVSTFTLSIFLALIFSASVFAGSIDAYVAPLGELSIPIHRVEAPYPAEADSIKAVPRVGFRVEAGKLSGNIALDVRFATLNGYQDFGASFRLFDCFGFDAAVKLCYGSGFGGSYSPGFITESSERTFFDPQLEPFIRFIFDSKYQFGFVLEASAVVTPQRSYATGTPESVDHKLKGRGKITAGLIFNWEEAQDPFSVSATGDDVVGMEGYAPVQFGLKGGFLQTKYRAASESSITVSDSRTGLAGGIAIDVGRGRWGFELDSIFAARRYLLETPTQSLIATAAQIEVVPLLRFRNVGASFVTATLGGFGSIPVGSATFSDGTSSTGTSPYNFGAVAGLGYGTRTKVLTLTAELRYSYGIRDLAKVGLAAGEDPGFSLRTSYLDFLIGFMF